MNHSSWKKNLIEDPKKCHYRLTIFVIILEIIAACGRDNNFKAIKMSKCLTSFYIHF